MEKYLDVAVDIRVTAETKEATPHALTLQKRLRETVEAYMAEQGASYTASFVHRKAA